MTETQTDSVYTLIKRAEQNQIELSTLNTTNVIMASYVTSINILFNFLKYIEF